MSKLIKFYSKPKKVGESIYNTLDDTEYKKVSGNTWQPQDKPIKTKSLKEGIEKLKKESTDVEGAAKYLPAHNPNKGKVKVTITPKHRQGQVGRPKGKPQVSYHDPKDLQKKEGK